MMATLDGLDAGFAAELQQMMKDAPGALGITSGARSHDQQAALYAKDPNMAAKPGGSWHEVGLAADLNFADSSVARWAHEHAADYGLFFPMSWEPWHVQPLWTQGRKPSPDASSASDAYTQAPVGQQTGQQGDPVATTLGAFKSLLGQPQGTDEKHPFDEQMNSFASAFQPATPPAAPSAATAAAGGNTTGGKLNYQAAFDLAVQAGATPEEATILAAIAGPESGYDPRAHNQNAATGDDSYGPWQINMLGQMGVDRARSLGLSSYDDLYDPATNARAAVSVLRSQGFDAWTAYKNGSYKNYLPAGAA